MSEIIFKYGWREFLKTPFTLLFFTLCIVVGFLVWNNMMEKKEEIIMYQNEFKNCNEERLKDKQNYINLLENMKINNELKKVK